MEREGLTGKSGVRGKFGAGFEYARFHTKCEVTVTTLPDASVSYTAYYPTGQIKATWGSQTYPTWFAYDAQNRQTQLHTWKIAPSLDPASIPANPPAGSEVTTWIYSPTRGLLTRKQ